MEDKKFNTKGLELIGAGSFSEAYKQKNGRVLLKTADIPKKAMADNLFPKHRLFPEVNPVGFEGSKELYDMPLYRQPTSSNYDTQLSPRQARLYNAFRTVAGSFYPSNNPEVNIQHFKNMPSEFRRESEACIKAYKFILDFTRTDEVGFEWEDCNLAMTGKRGNAKLVLLDCFYTWDSEKRCEGDSGLDD
jgi:hypothetical protein